MYEKIGTKSYITNQQHLLFQLNSARRRIEKFFSSKKRSGLEELVDDIIYNLSESLNVWYIPQVAELKDNLAKNKNISQAYKVLSDICHTLSNDTSVITDATINSKVEEFLAHARNMGWIRDEVFHTSSNYDVFDEAMKCINISGVSKQKFIEELQQDNISKCPIILPKISISETAISFLAEHIDIFVIFSSYLLLLPTSVINAENKEAAEGKLASLASNNFVVGAKKVWLKYNLYPVLPYNKLYHYYINNWEPVLI